MKTELFTKFEEVLSRYMESNEELRDGQICMVTLQEVDKETYMKILGTEFDCFYDDSKIPLFYEKLFEYWEVGFGRIRVLGPVEKLSPRDKLISDIGWIVGTDKQGRTLYHYSIEECRKLINKYFEKY